MYPRHSGVIAQTAPHRHDPSDFPAAPVGSQGQLQGDLSACWFHIPALWSVQRLVDPDAGIKGIHSERAMRGVGGSEPSDSGGF